MKTAVTVKNVHYLFEFHGIEKYFDKVYRELDTFKLMGRVMDPTAVPTEVFHEISKQCLEYK